MTQKFALQRISDKAYAHIDKGTLTIINEVTEATIFDTEIEAASLRLCLLEPDQFSIVPFDVMTAQDFIEKYEAVKQTITECKKATRNTLIIHSCNSKLTLLNEFIKDLKQLL